MQFSPTYAKIQWLIILLVFLTDLIWIKFSSFEIYYDKGSILFSILFLSIFFLPYCFYKIYRPDPKILTALHSTLLFYCFTPWALILSYLVYTTNFPLFNDTLNLWDSYFGFYAPDLILWIRAHTWLDFIFGEIYKTYHYQFPLIIVYFSFFVKTNDTQRFILLFMISLLLTLVVSTFVPAYVTSVYFNLPLDANELGTFNTIVNLRNNIVDLTKGYGLVTFPSFHTTAALIYIYMFRNQPKFIFIPVLILNSFIIFSCLTHGAHYLVDLFGGAAVFLFAIVMEHYIFVSTTKHDSVRVKSKESSKEPLLENSF